MCLFLSDHFANYWRMGGLRRRLEAPLPQQSEQRPSLRSRFSEG